MASDQGARNDTESYERCQLMAKWRAEDMKGKYSRPLGLTKRESEQIIWERTQELTALEKFNANYKSNRFNTLECTRGLDKVGEYKFYIPNLNGGINDDMNGPDGVTIEEGRKQVFNAIRSNSVDGFETGEKCD